MTCLWRPSSSPAIQRVGFPLADHAPVGDLNFDVKIHFPLFISAYLNVNTNATTRGDAQVSRHSSHL